MNKDRQKLILIFMLVFLALGVFQVSTYGEILSGNYVSLEDGFIAYDKYGNSEGVLILIHGSPGSKESLSNLARGIEEYEVYAIDMYGFGDSSKIVKNYGIEKQADVLAEFMNELGIEKASVLGYSWGGGVLINFAHKYPEKLNKGILLASMGVQEGEPTGSYFLEQTRSLISYPFVVFYPGSFAGDMGWRKGFMRSFLDSDLRKIREILPETEADFLILHGDEDDVVPYWVAMESDNLIPNSRLESYSGGHGQVFSDTTELAKKVEAFLDE